MPRNLGGILMKAIVCTKKGPPEALQLIEVAKPTPKDDEVQVIVHASSVNYGDLPVLRGEPLQRLMTGGLLKPKHKILGDDIAGRIEAVGVNINQFQPGDDVFGISNFGAFAEYVSVP
jgi:NADPH:quinone reductase-like Zn-dependent oxidoreductase